MSIRTLPPQVRVVCDDCGEALGEREHGYVILTDADAFGDRADLLDQYDWTTRAGKHLCAPCSEKAGCFV